MAPITTYYDALYHPESVADIIYMTDWLKAPLLNAFGFNSGNRQRLIPDAAWPAQKPTWLSDTAPPNTATLSGDIDNVVTTIPLGTGEGAYFRVGDLLVLRDTSANDIVLENMLVTAVAADSVDVTRDFPAGTTPTSAGVTGDTILRYSSQRPELSEPNPSYVTKMSDEWNGVQIIEDTVTVSRSEEIAKKYGHESTMRYRIAKRFMDGGSAGTKAQELENTFFYGKRQERSETADGSIGGIDEFLRADTIFDAGGDSLTEDDFRTVLTNMYNLNGEPDVAIINPATSDIIDKLYMDRIRTGIDENRGGSSYSSIMTTNGEIMMLPHRHCPKDVIYFAHRGKCGWVPYDPFFIKENPETADGWTSRIIGEYTWVLTEKVHFAKIHNFTA